MNDLLKHPWIKVLVIATTIAMCSLALREIGSIVSPVVTAVGEVLVPVAIGFAIAYIVLPLVDALTRLGLKRTLAAGLLFGVGTLALAGTMALLLPAVVRQGADLTVSLFQGEPFVDQHNDGYSIGDPFTDLNHNGQREGPLLGRFATWAEASQNRLRVAFGLGLNDQGLALLLRYQSDTAPLLHTLDGLLTAGRSGLPESAWPVIPDGLPAATGDGEWSPEWPGRTTAEIAAAGAYVPASHRADWWIAVRRIGLALHQRHADWLGALRQAKAAVPPTGDGAAPLVGEVQAAWAEPLSPERRQEASIYALALEAQARGGLAPARVLLSELGANLEAGTGLSEMADDLEKSVRSSFGDLPSKLGTWAKEGVSGWSWVMTWVLNLILIPIYAFFLVLAMPRIRAFVKDYLPSQHRIQVIRITREIEAAVSAFFRGRLLICALCALLGIVGFLGIGLFGIRVPYGVLFGVGIGLATAIPLSGLLFLLPALVLTMLQPNAGAVDLIAVCAIYAAVQGLEMILIPAIMGREVELHPVTLIIALLLCGKLLGVIGLVLAVPIAASFRILAREYFWPRLRGWLEHGRWEPLATSAPTGHDLPSAAP